MCKELVTNCKSTGTMSWEERLDLRYLDACGDAKGTMVLKAHVSGLFYVVGVCLLLRQRMVGKCSTYVESPVF